MQLRHLATGAIHWHVSLHLEHKEKVVTLKLDGLKQIVELLLAQGSDGVPTENSAPFFLLGDFNACRNDIMKHLGVKISQLAVTTQVTTPRGTQKDNVVLFRPVDAGWFFEGLHIEEQWSPLKFSDGLDHYPLFVKAVRPKMIVPKSEQKTGERAG